MMDLPTTTTLTTVTITLSVTVVLLSLLWWWFRGSSHRPSALPPSPRGALPLIGHLHLMTKDPRVPFKAWQQQYGDVFSLYMGRQLTIVLNGYEVIKEALVKHGDVFSNRPDFIEILPLLTKAKGVGDTSGPVWKVQRKTTLDILRQLGMGKNLLAEKVREEVGEFIKSMASKDSLPFDPTSLIQISISNNICSIVFGKRFEYDDQHFLQLVESIEEVLKLLGTTSVVYILPFLRHVPGDLFKVQRVVNQYQHIVNTFAIPAIQQHIKDYREGQQEDFISAYLRETKSAPERQLADIVNEFNLEKVIMDLFFGGTDTTSATIRWAIIYLLHHPEVQDRCYQDIVNCIGTSRPPEIGDRAGIVYVEATIMEVLRICDLVPLGVIRSTSSPIQFRGYNIPKDVYVIPNLNSVLHDPAVWIDPSTFRPERFIDDEGRLVRPDQFLSFSAGRRNCLGESLARVELFLYLSTMIQNFRFLPPEDGQLPSLQGNVGLVHSPRPFLVRAVPRN